MGKEPATLSEQYTKAVEASVVAWYQLEQARALRQQAEQEAELLGVPLHPSYR